jgi:predicted CoA-binding protein
MNDARALRHLFADVRTIAIVGLSRDWFRPSYFVAKYLKDRGYRIVPVNPRYEEVLGLRCYPDLASVPERVDVVDVFRRAEEAPAIAREAVAIGARVLWLQLGVVSAEAKAIASAAGLTVVMDRCMKIEFARLFGGLGWCGVDTGVVSARRAVAPPRPGRAGG